MSNATMMCLCCAVSACMQASASGAAKKGRKKARGNCKVNIKNSPILLRDGDIVGIKVRNTLLA